MDDLKRWYAQAARWRGVVEQLKKKAEQELGQGESFLASIQVRTSIICIAHEILYFMGADTYQHDLFIVCCSWMLNSKNLCKQC